MTGPAIELQKVSKSYRSHERFIEALADISLCIDPADRVERVLFGGRLKC
jgi:hypothetical protein